MMQTNKKIIEKIDNKIKTHEIARDNYKKLAQSQISMSHLHNARANAHAEIVKVLQEVKYFAEGNEGTADNAGTEK